jgi:hypothetical protein
MKAFQSEMANKVFERTNRAAEMGSRLDTHTFNILMAIDGKKSVATIAQEDQHEISDLVDQVKTLLDSGLIKLVLSVASNEKRHQYFKKLKFSLRRIIGPIGDMIIKDQVALLGYDISNFPMGKAYELVNNVSLLIPDKGKAESFVRSMTNEINS